MIRLMRVDYPSFPIVVYVQANEGEDLAAAWDRANAIWSAKALATFPNSTGALLCPLCKRPYVAHDTTKPMGCPPVQAPTASLPLTQNQP